VPATARGDPGIGGEGRVGGDPVLVFRRLEVMDPKGQHRPVVGAAGEIGEVAGSPRRLLLGLVQKLDAVGLGRRFRVGYRVRRLGSFGDLPVQLRSPKHGEK
jgi:hypothetical protein